MHVMINNLSHLSDDLTGNYEDDFEEMEDSHDVYAENSTSGSESEAEAEDSPKQDDDGASEEESEDETEEEGDQLTLTIADVKKLRQSLEMNASIRESLARQAATSDSEETERGK